MADTLENVDLIEREERDRENNKRGDPTDYGDSLEIPVETPPADSAEAQVQMESQEAKGRGGPYRAIDATRALPWLMADLHAVVEEIRESLGGASTEDWS